MKVYNKPLFWVGLSGIALQIIGLFVIGLVALFKWIGVRWMAIVWYAIVNFLTTQRMIIMLVAIFIKSNWEKARQKAMENL